MSDAGTVVHEHEHEKEDLVVDAEMVVYEHELSSPPMIFSEGTVIKR